MSLANIPSKKILINKDKTATCLFYASVPILFLMSFVVLCFSVNTHSSKSLYESAFGLNNHQNIHVKYSSTIRSNISRMVLEMNNFKVPILKQEDYESKLEYNRAIYSNLYKGVKQSHADFDAERKRYLSTGFLLFADKTTDPLSIFMSNPKNSSQVFTRKFSKTRDDLNRAFESLKRSFVLYERYIERVDADDLTSQRVLSNIERFNNDIATLSFELMIIFESINNINNDLYEMYDEYLNEIKYKFFVLDVIIIIALLVTIMFWIMFAILAICGGESHPPSAKLESSNDNTKD